MILFFFLLFRATPVAHLSFQARGGIRAAVAGLCSTTAKRDLSHACRLHHSSQQRWIPNPLSEARNQTHIPKDISQIRFLCAKTGTPQTMILNIASFLLLAKGLHNPYSEFFLATIICVCNQSVRLLSSLSSVYR